MGGRPSQYDSPNFSGGKFRNLVPTPMSSNGYSMWKAAYEFFFNKDKNSYPQITLPARALSRQEMNGRSSEGVAVTWLGHSMALVTGKDAAVITDPVFNAGKLPPLAMGPKPFPYAATYDVGDLPDIDVVLISHDHFDHLDMESIRKLKGSSFGVPRGVKSHLLEWGIDEAHVHEFDWYDEKAVGSDLELVFAPARHFSGRGLWNGKSTLWGSWVIKLEDRKIYYGGDSGYFNEFKKIGATCGPCDLFMLDNGQYNAAWQALHMLPEETVQASRDLRAEPLLPIHRGKDVLSLHS